jgi:hypothetical protein
MPPRPGSTSPPSSKGGGRWPATAHRRYATMYSRHSSSMEEGEAHVQLPPLPLRPRSITAHHPGGGGGGGPRTATATARASFHAARHRWGEGGPASARRRFATYSRLRLSLICRRHSASIHATHHRWGGGGGGPIAATVPAATNGTDAEDLLACRLRDSGIDGERATVRERERR